MKRRKLVRKTVGQPMKIPETYKSKMRDKQIKARRSDEKYSVSPTEKKPKEKSEWTQYEKMLYVRYGKIPNE